MNTKRMLLGMALALATPLAAQKAVVQPELDIGLRANEVWFRVAGAEDPFLGVVLLAMTPQLTHYFRDLPPLLTDPVVLGYGMADEANIYVLRLSEFAIPPGVMFFAQGMLVTKTDVLATAVRDLVVDATGS